MRRCALVAGLAVALALQCATGALGATLEQVGDFDRPMFITSDPANPDRLFVVEREGRVIEVGNGVFADLTSLVSCCVSERGLLSIALAPDFAATGRFYAAYTGTAAAGSAEGDIHVDAFRHDGGGLLREPILVVDHAAGANHNGGQLQFGPDGYLYVSTGDGGGGGDPLGSGQSLDTLLGKVLRIDPRPGAEPPYEIPTGNPFAAGTGLDEIWSYGLRNPWRFSFDRATGDMVVADVGQGAREEVDFAPSLAAGAVGGGGANYGWNCREGSIAFPEAPEACTGASGFTDPVFDYPHDDPGDGGVYGCAITGGYVVRDPSLGDLYGRYVYADFCGGPIRSLALPAMAGVASEDRSEGVSVANPTSFGEDSCGRLYVASNKGAVYRFRGTTPAECSGSIASSLGAIAPSPGGGTRRRVRVRLRASMLRERGSGLRLTAAVRVSPCAGNGGKLVQLNRGGERFAAKRLSRHCTTLFRLWIGRRSTFRALLPPDGYRSQVLTIALAKPRP